MIYLGLFSLHFDLEMTQNVFGYFCIYKSILDNFSSACIWLNLSSPDVHITQLLAKTILAFVDALWPRTYAASFVFTINNFWMKCTSSTNG